MIERPTSVPSEATWEDGEWRAGPVDADGELHGLATYWRPNGTLVNHCHYAHGVPHGAFKRYHESGEVSRAGEFVDGKLHGVDACFRSTAPTTERAFPRTLPANVWRYEVDMVMGRATTARWFDRDGNRVTDTGEPFPERPAAVPATAVYFSKSATWVDGGSDDAGEKHGLWRTWSRAGVLVAEVELDHGATVATCSYACAEDGDVAVALREGRRADAIAAARRWLARADGGQDRILAGDALARALDDGDERRAILQRIADAPPVSWVFTDLGKRCYRAQAAALSELAREAADAARLDDALALCRRAIAMEASAGPCAARTTMVHVLRRLGRDDEAFAIARGLFAADPDRADLGELRADPRFATWLQSLSTEGMTADSAWDVIGAVAAVAASITRDDESDDDESDDDGIDRPWPIREALGERLSPELATWLDLAPRLRGSDFIAAGASSLGDAIAARDGKWIARLAGLFLPVSVVAIDREEIWHAAWAANEHGASHVFYTHQDEPGLWSSGPSLAAFVADRIAGDSAFEDVALPAATVVRRARAIELLRDAAMPAAIAELHPRTGWVVRHLLGIAVEHGLADAPGLDRWHAERADVAAWPHLQVYWLLHHLVFDNREELPHLIEHAERRHPAVAELVALAEAVTAGHAIAAAWWDDSKVRGLRANAADTGHERVFGAPARARLREALAARDAAAAELDAALASLGDDPVVAHWKQFASIAGQVAALEEAMLAKRYPDKGERMSYFMLQKTGHHSMLTVPLERMLADVTPSARALFAAAVRRDAGFDEDHASVAPGALVGLGGASDDFAGAHAIAFAQIGEARMGRRRRLELAIVAARRFGEPAARAFLIAEAKRYAHQLAAGAWQVDTASYALAQLLELDPAAGGEILAGALASTPRFTGANWQPALQLIAEARARRAASAAPGILAAIGRKLGRHDDGERANVLRAYAACGGATAAATLEERYAAITGSSADCERCAYLAAFVDLDPRSERRLAEARAVLAHILDGAMDSASNVAAISLLRAIADASAAGFGELAARVYERARDDKHTRPAHVQWLAEALPRFAAA